MRSKISVVDVGRPDLTDALSSGRVNVLTVNGNWHDLAGSDVVVLAGGEVRAAAREIARRAPAAVLVVATGDSEADCAAVLQESLLPRPRVIGVARDDVAAVVEAVLYGGETRVDAAVLCRGELGIDDRVATVPVRLGRGGVRRIG
jgi:malate/lactate dehydrogenase